MNANAVSNPLQTETGMSTLIDLGSTLRQAREAHGISLAGMAERTGYSRSYLGNVETGVRAVTPALVRAYERALGDDDVNRRTLLLGVAGSLGLATTAAPDEAVDVFRDVAAGRSKLLSSLQTSHETDVTIGQLLATDSPSIAILYRWMSNGPSVLRVNSAGILAKVGSPAIADDVVRSLKADSESRDLYMTAVLSRVLAVPWDDARSMTIYPATFGEAQFDALSAELLNPRDAGARWCCAVLLAGLRPEDPATVDGALQAAIASEQSREILRTIAAGLAGVDPLSVGKRT